ncbi:MAG: hypothetical protein PVF96_03895 [Candidatus Bathyarchaeota archaeon]|jgi:hypothetical protein
MKINRFLQDRKGITPILSNLLLTIVAVAAMSIATTATYVITTNLRETMGERIIVEDLWFTTPDKICIYLRNIGRVNIHISAVYVNHTSRSFTSPFRLKINEHGWLNMSYTWSPDDLYYVDIITTRGTHAEDSYKAP